MSTHCSIGKELSEQCRGILHMDGKDTAYGTHYFLCLRCQGYGDLADREQRQTEESVTKHMAEQAAKKRP